jgi:hypothetical protein
MLVAPRTRDVHPPTAADDLRRLGVMTALDVLIVDVGLSDLGRDVGERSLSNLSWRRRTWTTA